MLSAVMPINLVSWSMCCAGGLPDNGLLHRMLGGSLGGAVFVCSAGTVQSCLQKGLLGMMQDTYIPIVQHVSVGMPVSLAGPHVAVLMQCNHNSSTLSPGGVSRACLHLSIYLSVWPVNVLHTSGESFTANRWRRQYSSPSSEAGAGVPVQPLRQDTSGAAVCNLPGWHVPGGAGLGQTRAQVTMACPGQIPAHLCLQAYHVHSLWRPFIGKHQAG